ncbi:hypothetical protein [Nocardia sp. NPDC052566]|uniref:hypothetical protein n=1 Tax=Nocardia sp. NPDC052566 TaxID=3364330 RepID=UPI0037C79101
MIALFTPLFKLGQYSDEYFLVKLKDVDLPALWLIPGAVLLAIAAWGLLPRKLRTPPILTGVVVLAFAEVIAALVFLTLGWSVIEAKNAAGRYPGTPHFGVGLLFLIVGSAATLPGAIGYWLTSVFRD